MGLTKNAKSFLLVALFTIVMPLSSQTATSDANTASATLQINSRAVLVDVIVMDRSGKPVTGLKQDAFTVTEQGKPQTVSFFEEHAGAPAAAPKEMPQLPPDVFSNFSPFPEPAAVNILLLDSLNTRMENQQFVHKQAMKFLKDLKPGSRMAIFTMGLGLHFVQGFTDDPALLFAALGNKKNNEVQASEMLKGQDETNAQQNVVGMMNAPVGGPGGFTAANPEMIAALQNFITENDGSQDTDRVLVTLANLQRLATFLNGFPGRKNVIWFSESPLVAKRVDPQVEQEWEKTRNMLAAARVALYPVDARGVATIGFYQADSKIDPSISQGSQMIGPKGAQTTTIMAESEQRGADQANMQRLADDTGGRAFVNTNGLSEVMAKITTESADFYTLSYTPTNEKMDGTSRHIEVKVAGGKFNLSYRRDYVARDIDLPGASLATRGQAIQKFTEQNPGPVDPLLAFMDLGMPQSEQIVYKVKIQPAATTADKPAAEQKVQKDNGQSYGVDFAIDLKGLDLKPDSEGQHKGGVNISLIAYDRYGRIGSRKDFVVPLNMKPDEYKISQQTGVQLHADMAVPKGQYWLRTGVYDQGSGKVGTMEVALSSVVPLPVATVTNRAVGSENAKTPVLVPPPPPPAVLPARARGVTVEQLVHTIAGAHAKKDQDLAKQLGALQLSERLSSPQLAKMRAGLPGEKSRLALLALADASAFLQLPAAEIPTTPQPDMPTQKLILNRAAENLVSAIHKLPDFFARQTTTRFHDLRISRLSNASAPLMAEHQAFQPLDSFGDTVYYRDGKEVEEPNQTKRKDNSPPRDGLVNWGVFGQLQRIVLTDIFMGKMAWSHWEQRASGPVAVFRYSIPKEKSTYVVNYCCVGLPNQPTHDFQSVPPFHGEIAIDPATGSVYRLVIITELSPSDPILQAEIMVEYEPVEIGGQSYVCPRKSVTITTAIAEFVQAGGCSLNAGCSPTRTYRPKDTAINDTEYDSSSYHVFRSEVRMLPAEDADQDQKPPADSTAPPSSTVPRP
jgi:VWFA-related protein